jgi:hypothetical protein
MATTTRVYHSTSAAAGESIRRAGFRDAEGSYGFAVAWLVGVFVSTSPADENEGAKSQDVVFAIDVPAAELEPYWFHEDGRPLWEACVPAEILNRCARTVVEYDHDLDEWHA